MDLASFIANKPLLASLTREYELLKATTADVNYKEWILARLKLAAAQQGSSLAGAAGADPTETTARLPTSQRTPTAPAQKQQQQAKSKPAVCDRLSGRLQALARQNRLSQQTAGSLPYDRDGAEALAGEQAAGKPPVITPVVQEWKAQDMQHDAAQSQVGSDSWAPAPLWRQPETSVDIVKTIPPSRNPPNWVAAAKLQSSLQSSSVVVPLLHAAAERDRRLAATAALVRQQLTVSNSAASVSTSAVAQQRALLAQHYGGGLGATELDQQQQQHLLRQVVQQNQQLLQAVQQQQALLQRHEGLLTDTSQKTATAATTAAPGNTAAVSVVPNSSQQLSEAVKESWLVKSVLHPSAGITSGGAVANGQSDAPEFIRITGEAGRQQGTLQQQEQKPPANRRSQLKAALRQLLTTKDISALPQQQSITGLLQALLEQQQQGTTDSSSLQQQQLITGLQAAVQALASKQQQRRRSSSRRSQDENALPPEQDSHTEQVSQRQQQQQPRRSSRVSSAAGIRPDSRQQQQQQQQQQQHSRREKPGWSSEVFVPPPSHMLRRQISGVTDAWGLSAPQKPKVCRTSAASTGRPVRPKRTAGTSAKGSNSRKTTAARGPTKQQRCMWAEEQCYSKPGTLQPALWGSAEFDIADPETEADEGLFPGYRPESQAAPAAVAPAAGLGAMTSRQIQTVELQVKQQLQQEQQREEESRLSRLEETATHILGVLGRLEQQLPNPPAAAAPAVTASSAAAASSAVSTLAAAAAQSAGELHDPLTMSSMLSALDRIEAQEAEIRRRWFGSSDISPAPLTAGMGAILEVKGGVLTAHPTNAPAATAAAGSATGSQQAVGSSSAQLQQCTGPPAAQQQQQQSEVLSNRALKSIRAGRSRFLKHQAIVDGSLEVLDSPSGVAALSPKSSSCKERKRAKQQLQPAAVVEAVADLLLDELILLQIEELDSFYDALCNQLFEAEFQEA